MSSIQLQSLTICFVQYERQLSKMCCTYVSALTMLQAPMFTGFFRTPSTCASLPEGTSSHSACHSSHMFDAAPRTCTRRCQTFGIFCGFTIPMAITIRVRVLDRAGDALSVPRCTSLSPCCGSSLGGVHIPPSTAYSSCRYHSPLAVSYKQNSYLNGYDTNREVDVGGGLKSGG